MNMKNHYNQSKREDKVKYQEAEREKREAEKEYKEFKTYWWVPIYGQYLAVRKIVEENNGKARAASRDMACHERDVEEAEREIERTNSGIHQVSCKLTMASMFSYVLLTKCRDSKVCLSSFNVSLIAHL